MKKIFVLAFLIVALVSSACAAAPANKIGFLARLNTTEEEFHKIIHDSWNTNSWSIFSSQHENDEVKFFDTMASMIMAVKAQQVKEIVLPKVTAEYVIQANPELAVCCAAKTKYPMSLAMGFRKDDRILQDRFNLAITALEDSWQLVELQWAYLSATDFEKLTPVTFPKFEGADTIKVAITGDLPPIDFINSQGSPSGFNVALLAEIARLLKINIELIQVDSNARTAALMSKRADVVFWYETSEDYTWKYDAGEDVILSTPYYSWNEFLHLTLKEK